MALEFAEARQESYAWLLGRFIAEATLMLDESVPLPRRAAIAYKWLNILKGLGFKPRSELSLGDLTPSRIRELASEMLRWVGSYIEKRRLL